MRPVGVLMFLAAGTLLVAAPDDSEKKPVKEGKCNDAHGHLAWKSSATRPKKGEEWQYLRTVKNHDGKRRCRVTWQNDPWRWSSTLDPDETQTPTEMTLDSTPADIDGKLSYNGGTEAGDAKAKAAAWLPKNEKPPTAARHVKAKVQLGFEYKKKFYKATVTGESTIIGKAKSSKHIKYVISGQVVPMLQGNDIAIAWTSINGKRLLLTLGRRFIDPESGVLAIKDFKKIHLEGNGPAERPMLSNGLIQIGIAGKPVAEGTLPAIITAPE